MDSDSLIRAEYKQRRFWVEHVNRKSALFHLICHEASNAKFLQFYRMLHPKIWVKLPPKNVRRPLLDNVRRLKFLCLTHHFFSCSTIHTSLVTYAAPGSKRIKSASPLSGRKRTQVASFKSWMAPSNSLATWSLRSLINKMFFGIQVPGWMNIGWVVTDWLTEWLSNWKIG